MMAEMIANYPTAGKGAAAAATPHPVAHDVAASQPGNIADAQSKAQVVPAVGSGYLNEVSSLTVRASGEKPRRLIVVVPLLPHGRRVASRRRAESLLVAVLSRRACGDAGDVQAIDPRPPGLVQQLHGGLRGRRSDRSSDRCETAFRYPHPQDRRPSRSCAAGPWPSLAHLAQLEARDSRPTANDRRSSRDVRRGLRAVQRMRICPGSAC